MAGLPATLRAISAFVRGLGHVLGGLWTIHRVFPQLSPAERTERVRAIGRRLQVATGMYLRSIGPLRQWQAWAGVEFIAANTDAQVLATSKATRRIQLGAHVTAGLGAGSHPDVGQAAAEAGQVGTEGVGGHRRGG